MRCEFCCRISTSARKMGITFHNFPKDDIIKNAWIRACVKRGCTLAKNMNIKTKRLCSNHFSPDDFEEDPALVRRKLKRNAVPTRFSKKPFLYCVACSDIAIEHSDVNLHEFPQDASKKKKWADICRQHDCDVKNIFPQYALCSNHFPRNCFIQNNGKKYLKHDAVPIIFSLPPNSVSSSMEQSENSIISPEFVIKSDIKIEASNDSMEESGKIIPLEFVDCAVALGIVINNENPNSMEDSVVISTNTANATFLVDNTPVEIAKNAKSTVEQLENSIISSEFVIKSDMKTEAFNDSMEESGKISTNTPNAIDLVENTSPEISSDDESHLPIMDSPTSQSSPKSAKKMRIWRPARVGDLREEHFDCPKEAKRNFHMLSAKCKQYKKQISLYRSKVWRLEKKVKTLENMFSQLTDKKLISKDTTSEIM